VEAIYLKKLPISKDMEDRLKGINTFLDRPVILAYNGSNLHVTFEAVIYGQKLFISLEDIPENYPSTTLWIFDDKNKLREIVEMLEEGGWYIEVAPQEI